MMHHCSFYWSSVKSFLANCFLIIGDHFRLHFYNIRQCQLTISWVAMVTCGPIVFPKVLWMQHLRIIFDFNALDMMQIFKSIPMVVNWYKTEIAQYFYKWCFFYIYYQTENMNRKGIMWVKASEGTAMPCGFTRHPQHGMGKSPSKCYNDLHAWRPVLYFPGTEFHTFFSGHVPISSDIHVVRTFPDMSGARPSCRSWPDCSLRPFL